MTMRIRKYEIFMIVAETIIPKIMIEHGCDI